MEEKVKQKINGGLRSTYLKLFCSDYHLMEACLWGYIGDSRAIMGSKDSNDSMVAIQLTVDLKPDLPSV